MSKLKYTFGEWVNIDIDAKLYGQFVHYTKDGKIVIDINGIWEEYKVNEEWEKNHKL